MLTVRKTLTEILLEVTNEEIHSISAETCEKYKNRGSSCKTHIFLLSFFSSLYNFLSLIKFLYILKLIQHNLSARLL